MNLFANRYFEDLTRAFQPITEAFRSLYPKLAEEMQDKSFFDATECLVLGSLKTDFMADKRYRDPVIHCLSYRPNQFPYIRVSEESNKQNKLDEYRYSNTRMSDLGITFYKTSTGIVYAYYYADTADCPYDLEQGVLILLKSDVNDFIQYCNKKHIEFNSFSSKPVLEEGLLEQICRDTVDFVQLSPEIRKYGARLKRGIILEGEPGNGKTMICRWIKKKCVESDIEFSVIKGSDIRAGHNHSKLDALLSATPIIFIDDVDVQFFARKSNASSDIACDLLSAMDGLGREDSVVRIFTTNEDAISFDRAFLRPGRIDRCYKIKPPTLELRKQLIETWPTEIKEYMFSVADQWLKQTDGFSFAEMESIRSNLVQNKLTGDGKWEIKVALDALTHSRKMKPAKSRAGF